MQRQAHLKPTPDAADLIMKEVDSLVPAGKTPLTTAVEQAAEVLDYRNKPEVIVVVTDGEETCGRSPCDLTKQLHDAAERLAIHIISPHWVSLKAGWTLQPDFQYIWQPGGGVPELSGKGTVPNAAVWGLRTTINF